MRVAGFMLLMAAFAAGAQTQSGAAKTAPTATGPITMQGCINGGQAGYTFTQSSTSTTFALSGDVSRFAPLRGKLVEVTGVETPPRGGSPTTDLPGLAARKTRVVADACPFHVQGKADAPGGTAPTVPGAESAPSTSQPAGSVETPPYQSPGAPNQTPPTAGNNPNTQGATGAPSPGTGNPPPPPAAPTPPRF